MGCIASLLAAAGWGGAANTPPLQDNSSPQVSSHVAPVFVKDVEQSDDSNSQGGGTTDSRPPSSELTRNVLTPPPSLTSVPHTLLAMQTVTAPAVSGPLTIIAPPLLVADTAKALDEDSLQAVSNDSVSVAPVAPPSCCLADRLPWTTSATMEDSLSDISSSSAACTPKGCSPQDRRRPSKDSSGSFSGEVLASGYHGDRSEELEWQRQQAPLSIEEDLFCYSDFIISKDEAQTKRWRLVGRKPLPMDVPNSSHSGGRRSSHMGSFFSFNDFAVCVDEMEVGSMLQAPTRPPSLPITATPSVDVTAATRGLPQTQTANSFTVTSAVGGQRNTVSAHIAEARMTAPKAGRRLMNFTCETILGHATRVKCIALTPSEKEFASCSNEDASVALNNLAVRDEVGIFTGHQDTVINACFSPDGRYLATTSKDKTMILWDFMTTKHLLTFSHAKVVICCCFGPDSKYIVSGCQDRICRLWDTRRGKEWLTYSHHEGIIIAVAFSPDGAHVCSASADKTLRVWSSATGKTRFVLQGHVGIILSVGYTSDGKYIVSNDEGLLRVWSTADGSCTLSLAPSDLTGTTHLGTKGPKLGWTLSAPAPGAFTEYVLVACNNRNVYLLDRDTGTEVARAFCKAPVYCLTAGTSELAACGDSFGNIYILHLT